MENYKKSRSKIHDTFVKELKLINPMVIVIGHYINSKTKVECKCSLCGKNWYSLPTNLLKGKKCSNCSSIDRAKKRTKSHEEFVSELNLKNPNIILKSEYKKSTDFIGCECSICGNIWNARAGSLLRGNGCSVCFRKRLSEIHKKSHEEFVYDLNKINKNIEIISMYKSSHERITCKCLFCGEKWDAMPSDLMSGTGCPNCNHSSTSYGEQFMLALLKYIFEDDVLSRDKKAIGKELDIYIPKYNIAIEYGSFFWHKKRQKNDIEKIKLCKAKNIELIMIYDDVSGNNDELINNDAMIFYDAMTNDDYIYIVNFVLKKVGVSYDFSEQQITKASDIAYELSRKKNTTQYIDELLKINPNVTVLSNYKSTHEKMDFQCNICGNKWSTLPQNLIKGHGCPKCGLKKISSSLKKSQEDFEYEIKTINPSVKIWGTYQGNKKHILCQCLNCGNKWSPTPDHLLRGRGCPKCGIIKQGKKRRKTHEQFVNEMKEINEKFLVVGNYDGDSKKIEMKCMICNCNWYATPSNLLRGTGCPHCYKNRYKC